MLSFLPCSLPHPSSPLLSLPFPPLLPAKFSSVCPLAHSVASWLFMCEVRAGWHCGSMCGQAVFTSVWPWSLEPGAVCRCILDISQKTVAGPGDRLSAPDECPTVLQSHACPFAYLTPFSNIALKSSTAFVVYCLQLSLCSTDSPVSSHKTKCKELFACMLGKLQTLFP